MPLSMHKEALIEFLGQYGPAPRHEILDMTYIPAGSLSELLKGDEFEQVEHGWWRLKETGKEPGTPTPPEE